MVIALIIAGSFFAFIIGVFVDAFVRGWIAENNMRKSYARKIDKIMSENWNI